MSASRGGSADLRRGRLPVGEYETAQLSRAPGFAGPVRNSLIGRYPPVAAAAGAWTAGGVVMWCAISGASQFGSYVVVVVALLIALLAAIGGWGWRELTRQREHALALAGAVRAVLAGPPGPATIVAAAQTITSAEIIALLQPDGEGDLVCSACTNEALVGRVLPIGDGSAATNCFTTGKPLWMDPPPGASRLDADAIGLAGSDLSFALGSAACYPILLGEHRLGVLSIGFHDRGGTVRSHGAELERLTSEIAVALSHRHVLLELERLAGSDPVTGVANRRAWRTQVGRDLARARRHSLPLSVLMIDLDHFKLYNDIHGHHAGDELLVTVARRWQRHLRPDDLLCRWGGDEFAVLLPDCTRDGAFLVADELRSSMPRGLTCSIGIAEWDHVEDHDRLVDRADHQLYLAKAAGRDCTHMSASQSTPQAGIRETGRA